MRALRFAIITILVTIFASSCSSNANAKAGSRAGELTPIAVYPANVNITYHSFIELVVSDVDRSAERALRMAQDYGSYLLASQSWYIDGRKTTSLQFAVPSAYYDSLRSEFITLGDFLGENVVSEKSYPYPGAPPYSQITLQLHSRKAIKPISTINGWNPLDTLESAFRVFVKIFSFLADVLIWILVVVVPIVLLGWLVWKLSKRIAKI